LLLQQGESPAYVQRQLGHTSIQLTVDTYGRWLPMGNNHPHRPLHQTHPGLTLESPSWARLTTMGQLAQVMPSTWSVVLATVTSAVLTLGQTRGP
jgi:hypothetical protein